MVAAYLRIIRTNRWHHEPGWMADDDLPADALKDVGYKELSVYEVGTKEEGELAAIAFFLITATKFAHIQYALIDPDDLEPLDIEVLNNPGTTSSQKVNEIHRELRLTARKASGLAHVMGKKRVFETIVKKVVESKVNEYCESGEIPCDSLSEALREKIPACR